MFNFKLSPKIPTGQWHHTATKIAGFGGVLPSDLFGQDQLAIYEIEAHRRHTLSYSLAQDIIESGPGSFTINEIAFSSVPAAKAVSDALHKLPPRLKFIIELRFGLDGYPRRTLKEAGNKLGYSGRRIGQLQTKAVERMIVHLIGTSVKSRGKGEG